HESEFMEASEEGVLFKWLTTIKQVDEGSLLIEKMELDESGYPQPTGELEELEADSLVLALGQETDLSLLDGVPGLVVDGGVVSVGPDMMTGCPGVFAGGDMVPFERSVTVAVGHGKRAARNIDSWLSGAAPEPVVRPALATYDTLNTWYYADAPRTRRPVLERARRESTFDEVVQGLDEDNALYEARRCMSCGNCFGCDNCYGVCPDNAVIKLGQPGEKYLIDLDYCKGCGICVAECPSGAIQMFPEEI
ncbi:MAG TPA: 4Fe-4S dicluster domain-containing protein, partial [Nocardioidaceae bacterium]|nr:4Fe-4S dicluster domain-containing protein [Nocardioidaceae bacterium]